METLKSIVRNIWAQRVALMVVGAGLGYWYYAAIGCERGCAITSDPWISTAYGALIGFLVHPGRSKTVADESKSGDAA
ncbi:MAG: hypothetical protein MUE68_07980 [Bacteroidetes bacterium]|nr:hypothetical protein [Bacteroidota bacterium]